MFVCRHCVQRYTKPFIGRDYTSPSAVKATLLRFFHNGAVFNDQQLSIPSQQKVGRGRPAYGIRRPPAVVKKWKESRKREVEVANRLYDDPVKVAERTEKLLRAHNWDTAFAFMCSRSRGGSQVSVGWNHLINYQIAQGNIIKAFKVFNNMKKRAQKPDAYTYTILLRGLSKYAHIKLAVPRAVKLYHSMLADSSPVKPSTIHINAIVNVCARAKDLDSMFGITSQLPKFGPGSPDNLTYTIILNAIRSVALNSEPHQRHEAAYQGRMIWRDVVDKWKRGTAVDEALVCAMGRLLMLHGTEQDYDDVLSLVEQTMRLPREIPRIGDSNRPTHLSVAAPKDADKAKSEDQTVSKMGLEAQENHNKPIGEQLLSVGVRNKDPDMVSNLPSLLQEDVGTPSEFMPLSSPSSIQTYARPGRNTLSLLMEACTYMNAIAAAHKYWQKITSDVEPDLHNFHTYLRLLRRSRSSAFVLELLKDLTTSKEEGGLGLKTTGSTYRIALSSCNRNWLHPSTLDTATAIMRVMMSRLLDPDVTAVEIYFGLLNKPGAKWSYKQMVEALRVIKGIVDLVRSRVFYGEHSRDENEDSTSIARDVRLEYPEDEKNEGVRSSYINPRNVAHNDYERDLLKLMEILMVQLRNVDRAFADEKRNDPEAIWQHNVLQETTAQIRRIHGRERINRNTSSRVRKLQSTANLPELDVST